MSEDLELNKQPKLNSLAVITTLLASGTAIQGLVPNTAGALQLKLNDTLTQTDNRTAPEDRQPPTLDLDDQEIAFKLPSIRETVRITTRDFLTKWRQVKNFSRPRLLQLESDLKNINDDNLSENVKIKIGQIKSEIGRIIREMKIGFQQGKTQADLKELNDRLNANLTQYSSLRSTTRQ